MWDTLTGKVFLAGPSAICNTSDYFKSVAPTHGETRAVEGVLSVVDGEFARLLRSIRENRRLPNHGSEDRVSLAYLLALQAVRGPQQRRIHNDMADYLTKLEAAATFRDFGVSAGDFVISAHNNSHIRVMAETARDLFADWAARDWTLTESQDDDFITCDNPVLYDDLSGPPEGLLSVDEILVPLSPKLVLGMTTNSEQAKRSVPQLRSRVERLVVRSRERWIIGSPSQTFFTGRSGKTVDRRRQLQLQCVHQYTPKGGRAACLMANTAIYASGPVIKTCGRHD